MQLKAYARLTNRPRQQAFWFADPKNVQLMVIALLASLFMIAIYISEIIQLCDHTYNPLIWLKVFSSILISPHVLLSQTFTMECAANQEAV